MNSAQISPVNRRKDVDNGRSGHRSRSRGTGPTRKLRTRTMSQTTPLIDKLAPLRAHKGKRRTTGLDDATLAKFAASHPELRSEEHTSELQSLMRISYAVFCLKKKNTTNYINNTTHVSTPTN